MLRTQILYPDAPPHSLVNTLEPDADDTRPNKRRKVAHAQSLHQLNGISESGIPRGYIPLARFVLDLNFSEPSATENSWDGASRLPTSFPVLLQSASLISPGSGPSLFASSLHEQSGPHVFKLELVTTSAKDIIFTDSSADPEIIAFGENLSLASRLVSADHFSKQPPTACYKSTLHCLPDWKSFSLETIILWKDSLVIPNLNTLPSPALQVFSKYVLRDERNCPSGYEFPGRNWRHRDLFSRRAWVPRDFYNNVYVPPDTPSTSAEIKGDLIESTLYPFQRRAVRWLLEREGAELLPDGQVVPSEGPSGDQPPASFQEATDAEGGAYFASPLFMTIATDFSGWFDPEANLRGGILAEEMGLGKTVEMISLICLNRRRLTPDIPKIGHDGLKISGATLIITPPAILEQWKQEIALHAPALRVFHYNGVHSHKGLSDQDLLERISDHDIVLTTYNVLAREVHYSGDAPKRNLRHEKRFEPRKTPLVQVSWWRVCLDEAQMIESGVSNAARVARLIPRQNAWAVTGTPIRKDISDLYGLLLFLNYHPFCAGSVIWNRLCHAFQPVLERIVNTVAIRHSKDHVRGELDLQPQKRVVITIPFTAIEEQHYGQLYEQMCQECGLDTSGGPLHDEWDPDDQATVEKMRNWLTRLRQTCLHPEVAGKNRRALGTGSGPLRSVAEVLEVMIDQNDTLIRAEERSLLQSQLRRGQMLENATRRQEAFDLWMASFKRAGEIVQECRNQLESERAKVVTDGLDRETPSVDGASDNEDVDKNTRLGTYRNRLRAALEIQHIGQFFLGNAYFQIKTDPKVTEPESQEYEDLEERETQAYEAAKMIRKEMLVDVSRKVDRYLKVVKDKTRNRSFVRIPKMRAHLYSTGLESRRVLEKFEDFCEAMNTHATKYNEWRDVMVKLLSLSLIDQEENAELEGNEYENSTKHQDSMYVYMEALRAMFADRHDALTGQKNVLIAHEVKGGILQAQKGEGPSPPLFLSIMNERSEIMPDPELGSFRGIISELRSLVTSLDWQASEGSSRARSELEIVNSVLENASQIAAEQGKVSAGLEREVEMFRDTMNNRLEYYRQLQIISDTVAPYDEESVGKPMDERVFSSKCKQETTIDGKISALKAKHRYLIHLRDESGSDDTSKICVVCQSSFEVGVLTVCGHKYCKDCLRLWWNQHRTCPTCKSRLKANDFHQITYKPQEFVAQEENPPAKIEDERASDNLIYSDVGSGLLREIKDIDLDESFGTKIDTLARHIMWLRVHDPGAKAVVFSQYRSFLRVLETAFGRFKIGYNSVDYRGGIERFKSDPAAECFLLHAKAHSSGLNLVNATHVFLCEPLINTAIELQAIARVHRIGQHRPTTVWMYLVSDTVEESIYNLSVSRRLAHIFEKEKEVDSSALQQNGRTAPGNLTEVAIDSANSMEMQDASLSRLMMGGVYGGEHVKKDDLWQCLFGKPKRKDANGHSSAEAEGEVGRFLRGEAAEQRREAGVNGYEL